MRRVQPPDGLRQFADDDHDRQSHAGRDVLAWLAASLHDRQSSLWNSNVKALRSMLPALLGFFAGAVIAALTVTAASPLRPVETWLNAGMASRPAGPRSADTRGMNSRPAIGGSDWDGRLGRTGRKVRLPGLVDRTSYAACP